MTAKQQKQSSIRAAVGNIIKPFTIMKEKFALSWVYDAVFYAVLVLVLTQFLALVKNQLIALQPLAQQAAVSPEIAEQAASLMTQLIWTAGASVVLVPLLALALYSLFKGLIWNGLAGKGFGISWAFLWKFFLLNLVWFVVSVPVFVAWLMLIFYLAMMFGINWLALIVLVLSIMLWLHLLATMHYSFAHSQKFGKSLGSIFTVGFAKINRFVFNYAVAVVLFLAWSQLWRLLAQIKAAPEVQLILAGVVIAAPFLGWLRIYISESLRTAIKN